MPWSMKISPGRALTWNFCAGAWANASPPAARVTAAAAPVARNCRRVVLCGSIFVSLSSGFLVRDLEALSRVEGMGSRSIGQLLCVRWCPRSTYLLWRIDATAARCVKSGHGLRTAQDQAKSSCYGGHGTCRLQIVVEGCPSPLSAETVG